MDKEFTREVAGWIRSRTADRNLAMSQVCRFEDLYGLLKEGIAHFWFRKTDGSLRSAYGTLERSIIERHGGLPEGEERTARPFNGAVSYYDLEKDAWRSFRADSVQEVDFTYGVE
jgi:hypothetical protein